MAPILHVIDKDGFPLGRIEARIGLRTYSGKVTRVSEKSIWVTGESGNERLYRKMDGRLPCIYKSYAPADTTWLETKTKGKQ